MIKKPLRNKASYYKNMSQIETLLEGLVSVNIPTNDLIELYITSVSDYKLIFDNYL